MQEEASETVTKRLVEQVDVFRQETYKLRRKMGDMLAALRLLQEGESDPVRKVFISDTINKAESWW